MIPKATIIELFKNKSKRPKKKVEMMKATEPESDGSIVVVRVVCNKTCTKFIVFFAF